jgi:dihydrodipicolinate synthase/N-acetylneuraminate lyase
MKEALRQLGVLEGASMRPPLLDLDAAEREAIRTALAQVELAMPAGVGSPK